MNEETTEVKESKKKKAPLSEQDKERRRRVAAAGIAVVTSASVVVGGLFNSPAALLSDEDPTAVVEYQNDDDDLDGDDGDGSGSGDDEGAGAEEGEARGGIRAGARQRIMELPYAVRLVVILPLWCLGWAILTLSSALWTAVLSPVLGKALGWLCLLAALVGAFVLAARMIFPDLPLKKILNKRSLLGLIFGSVGLGIADIVVPLFWTEYTRIENIVRAVGVLLVFGTVTMVFIRRELKRRRALAEAEAAAEIPEEVPEEPRPLTERDILALADSVSRR